jgi:transcriptional regulator with XRE-family HTH domain
MTYLEYLRRQQGLTLIELGKRVLYSDARLSILENHRPPLDQVHPRLKRALEIYFNESFDRLMSDADAILRRGAA